MTYLSAAVRRRLPVRRGSHRRSAR
jgi:hypothetical protein